MDEIVLTCGHPYTTEFPVTHVSKAWCDECKKFVLMKPPAGKKVREEEEEP
jgi:hypothetical protein